LLTWREPKNRRSAVECAPGISGEFRTEFEHASARPPTPTGGTLEIPDNDAI
jgi:hypothetical protein